MSIHQVCVWVPWLNLVPVVFQIPPCTETVLLTARSTWATWGTMGTRRNWSGPLGIMGRCAASGWPEIRPASRLWSSRTPATPLMQWGSWMEGEWPGSREPVSLQGQILMAGSRRTRISLTAEKLSAAWSQRMVNVGNKQQPAEWYCPSHAGLCVGAVSGSRCPMERSGAGTGAPPRPGVGDRVTITVAAARPPVAGNAAFIALNLCAALTALCRARWQLNVCGFNAVFKAPVLYLLFAALSSFLNIHFYFVLESSCWQKQTGGILSNCFTFIVILLGQGSIDVKYPYM